MKNIDATYPEGLRERERELIEIRRGASSGPKNTPPIGLAISGGGIRSATFALGVLQVLAEKRILSMIDFLSTVSGGSFIGGFLGRLYTRDCTELVTMVGKKPEKAESCGLVEWILSDSNSKPIRFLRASSRYLAPRASSELLLALAVTIRNWLALILVASIPVLAVFLAANALRYSVACYREAVLSRVGWLASILGDGSLPSSLPWRSPYLLAPFVFIVLALLAVLVFWILELPTFRRMCNAVIKKRKPDQDENSLDSVRRRGITYAFLWVLIGLLSSVIFGVVDTVGQSLYTAYITDSVEGFWTKVVLPIYALVSAGVVSARNLAAYFGDTLGKKRMGVPFGVLAGVAAFILVSIHLIFVNAVAHGFAWGWQAPPGVVIQEESARTSFHIDIDSEAPASVAVSAGSVDEREEIKTSETGAAKGALRSWWSIGVTLIVSALFTYGLGKFVGFLDTSSFGPLYYHRLARAYLGASNPERLSNGGGVTDPVPGDDLGNLAQYQPYKGGGPLHIINVTVNETVSAEDGTENRDRRGMNLAVGPAGLSVAARHHAVWDPEPAKDSEIQPITRAKGMGTQNEFSAFTKSFNPESLSLARWVAISGAAFSTGMGGRTSLGLSILCGMVNLRLGYWWDSGIDPAERGNARFHMGLLEKLGRRVARMQTYLYNEFTSQFYGIADKHWYLTDGGHFENTGCYELVRRRLPYIIVCDNGQDPAYRFEDISNLVRKARMDFGGEIKFLDSSQLNELFRGEDRRYFGELEQLRRGTWSDRDCPSIGDGNPPKVAGGKLGSVEDDEYGCSFAHAAIAYVQYDEPEKRNGQDAASLIVFVKPTLLGDEPADLIHYHSKRSAFPQETTSDQFFDEAQWECYRKLGSTIADRLFVGSNFLRLAISRSVTVGNNLTLTCDETGVWLHATTEESANVAVPPARSG